MIDIEQNAPSDVSDVQFELTRLSSENMELLSKMESMDKLNKKLKRQLKVYSRKFNMAEGWSQCETTRLINLVANQNKARCIFLNNNSIFFASLLFL